MRIDSSGNVNFGVPGGQGLENILVTPLTPTKMTFNRPASSGVYYPLDFRNGATNVGYISYNDTGTTYSTSSDYRLKDNITPFTSALLKLNQLKPCNYTWKVNDQEAQGFIAHELQEVVPAAVVGQKDEVDEQGNPRYQGVDYSKVVPLLTAAIQELASLRSADAVLINELASLRSADAVLIAELSSLRSEDAAKIASLESALTDVMSRLSALEQQ